MVTNLQEYAIIFLVLFSILVQGTRNNDLILPLGFQNPIGINPNSGNGATSEQDYAKRLLELHLDPQYIIEILETNSMQDRQSIIAVWETAMIHHDSRIIKTLNDLIISQKLTVIWQGTHSQWNPANIFLIPEDTFIHWLILLAPLMNSRHNLDQNQLFLLTLQNYLRSNSQLWVHSPKSTTLITLFVLLFPNELSIWHFLSLPEIKSSVPNLIKYYFSLDSSLIERLPEPTLLEVFDLLSFEQLRRLMTRALVSVHDNNPILKHFVQLKNHGNHPDIQECFDYAMEWLKRPENEGSKALISLSHDLDFMRHLEGKERNEFFGILARTNAGNVPGLFEKMDPKILQILRQWVHVSDYQQINNAYEIPHNFKSYSPMLDFLVEKWATEKFNYPDTTQLPEDVSLLDTAAKSMLVERIYFLKPVDPAIKPFFIEWLINTQNIAWILWSIPKDNRLEIVKLVLAIENIHKKSTTISNSFLEDIFEAKPSKSFETKLAHLCFWLRFRKVIDFGNHDEITRMLDNPIVTKFFLPFDLKRNHQSQKALATIIGNEALMKYFNVNDNDSLSFIFEGVVRSVAALPLEIQNDQEQISLPIMKKFMIQMSLRVKESSLFDSFAFLLTSVTPSKEKLFIDLVNGLFSQFEDSKSELHNQETKKQRILNYLISTELHQHLSDQELANMVALIMDVKSINLYAHKAVILHLLSDYSVISRISPHFQLANVIKKLTDSGRSDLMHFLQSSHLANTIIQEHHASMNALTVAFKQNYHF